jgi:hypothetical protein
VLRIPLPLVLGLVLIPVRDLTTLVLRSAAPEMLRALPGMLYFALATVAIYTLLSIGLYGLAHKARPRARGLVFASAILLTAYGGWHVLRAVVSIGTGAGGIIGSEELVLASQLASMAVVVAVVLLAIAAADVRHPLVIVAGVAACVLAVVRGWIPFVGQDLQRFLSRNLGAQIAFSMVTALAYAACLFYVTYRIASDDRRR